jgi:hypothetical protein
VPDLTIIVEGAVVVPYAMAPTLAFTLRATNDPADQQVHTAVLRCQLHLEVTRRRYTTEEESRLRDLFGEPKRWSQTLRTMLWTHASVVLPAFAGTTTVELLVPCSYDFNLAATKYFHGLTDGEIPLDFLFSGSVFYEDEGGNLQVAPISWEKEARFRLSVKTWRELMDAYYPNISWLELRRDVFERLYEYKVSQGIPTWEQAVESILPPVTKTAPV